MPRPAHHRVDPATDFGIVLRELRRRRGLSQEALAFACGISREYVGLLERGQNLPSVRTLLVLAEALETQPSEIFRAFEARR